jgi:glycosyltransferase involved in cell wall biosynthesis
VRPHIDGERVRFIGVVGAERRNEILGGARALLHLVNFDEPFGFSVVEAMASGTPVITHRRGSMPEIVREGESGFLVDSLDAAVGAVHRAAHLTPTRVRATVEARFDVNRMVDDYVAVYDRVLALAHEQRRCTGARELSSR